MLGNNNVKNKEIKYHLHDWNGCHVCRAILRAFYPPIRKKKRIVDGYERKLKPKKDDPSWLWRAYKRDVESKVSSDARLAHSQRTSATDLKKAANAILMEELKRPHKIHHHTFLKHMYSLRDHRIVKIVRSTKGTNIIGYMVTREYLVVSNYIERIQSYPPAQIISLKGMLLFGFDKLRRDEVKNQELIGKLQQLADEMAERHQRFEITRAPIIIIDISKLIPIE